MSPRTTDRPAPSPDLRVAGRLPWTWLAAALAFAAAIMGTNRLTAGPAFVERLTVVNSTAYGVDIAVSGAGDRGWLELGVAENDATTAFDAVLDQGDTWIVRLADGQGGELRITHDELRRAGWRVQVPPELEARLRPTWGPPEQLA